MRYLMLAATLLSSGTLAAQSPATKKLETKLANYKLPGLIRSAIGVTRRGTAIPCLLNAEGLDQTTNKFRVLLIGGMDGEDASVSEVLAAVRWFQAQAADSWTRQSVLVSCVPCVNPDGWAAGRGGQNLSGGATTVGFPPQDKSYNSPTNPEVQYLWRWLGMHAPDLVIDVRQAKKPNWRTAQGATGLTAELSKRLSPIGAPVDGAKELIVALGKSRPSDTGTIPALRFNVAQHGDGKFLAAALDALEQLGTRPTSPARRELQRRIGRSAKEISIDLSRYYGHDLKQVVYIPSLALIGRLRLGELTGNKDHQRDVERIVSSYLKGDRPTMGKRVSGSGLSGHMVFTELMRRTKNSRYLELAKKAADLGFRDGRMLESMPAHSEMSDAVFMGCPILAETGMLTGERRYFEMCVRHLKFMQKHCLREDGLYRHSPLDEAAWGRGNGFPALGLALSASALPKEYAQREFVLDSLRAHLRALQKHQDPTGAWHQVIDHPQSYREFTSTCMITFAMIRGVREGWLPAREFRPTIERAWRAIQTRIGNQGNLVDVCTGTGKQKDLRAYYDRTAILGRDARGGAMALMVATEMASWK